MIFCMANAPKAPVRAPRAPKAPMHQPSNLNRNIRPPQLRRSASKGR